jgi:transposase InsO family protein
MLQRSIDHNVELHFIDPGKPAQNAWIESFNGRVRDEFLNTNAFWTLAEIREAADVWLVDNCGLYHDSFDFRIARSIGIEARGEVCNIFKARLKLKHMLRMDQHCLVWGCVFVAAAEKLPIAV